VGSPIGLPGARGKRSHVRRKERGVVWGSVFKGRYRRRGSGGEAATAAAGGGENHPSGGESGRSQHHIPTAAKLKGGRVDPRGETEKSLAGICGGGELDREGAGSARACQEEKKGVPESFSRWEKEGEGRGCRVWLHLFKGCIFLGTGRGVNHVRKHVDRKGQ